MKRRLYCDRIEEGTAVLLDADDTVYRLPAERLPDGLRSEGAHLLCTLRNGEILMAEPTDAREAGEGRRRLAALFRRQKAKKHK